MLESTFENKVVDEGRFARERSSEISNTKTWATNSIYLGSPVGRPLRARPAPGRVLPLLPSLPARLLLLLLLCPPRPLAAPLACLPVSLPPPPPPFPTSSSTLKTQSKP
jgi:hypothetical protein